MVTRGAIVRYTFLMRRAAHLVAPIVIVLVTIGESIALRPAVRLGARSDAGTIVDALSSSRLGDVAAGITPHRLIAAYRFGRGDSTAVVASPADAAVPRRFGRIKSSLGPQSLESIAPDTVHGRAPPFSR
jgi:hypothetical protein